MLSIARPSLGRMRPIIAGAALALGAIAPLASCSDSTSAGNAKLSLLLTDAPGDVKTAVVTIDEIYLQGSGRVVAVHGLDAVEREFGELIVDRKIPEAGTAPSTSYEGEGFIILKHPSTSTVEAAVLKIVSTVRAQLG